MSRCRTCGCKMISYESTLASQASWPTADVPAYASDSAAGLLWRRRSRDWSSTLGRRRPRDWSSTLGRRRPLDSRRRWQLLLPLALSTAGFLLGMLLALPTWAVPALLHTAAAFQLHTLTTQTGAARAAQHAHSEPQAEGPVSPSQACCWKDSSSVSLWCACLGVWQRPRPRPCACSSSSSSSSDSGII